MEGEESHLYSEEGDHLQKKIQNQSLTNVFIPFLSICESIRVQLLPKQASFKHPPPSALE